MLLCVVLSDRSDWNIGPGYPDPWPQASKLRISCLAQGAQRCSQPQRQLQVKTDQNGDEAANGTLSPEALLQACVLAGNPQPRRPTPHVQAQISFKHRSTSFCVFWFGVRRPGMPGLPQCAFDRGDMKVPVPTMQAVCRSCLKRLLPGKSWDQLGQWQQRR